jgi:geranylgeranyl pyrophosphate synthase
MTEGAGLIRGAGEAAQPPAADAWALPERIGLADEAERLRTFFADWIERCDPEMQAMLRYQLSPRSKYFRPVTIFACQRAVGGDDPEALIPVAATAELLHNYATVTDDIVDRDRVRRGQAALHCRFGMLPAVMAGAYMAFAAFELIADDEYATRLFTRLGMRIAAIECRQWRLRRQPLGVDSWRALAGEDTGGMFETCACVATRDDRLARFGYLLGTLYHGCDDIADIRGTLALGAHSERDVTDRIVTLPAALATRDPEVAELFAAGGEDRNDELVEEAEREARENADHPDVLLELVRYTRELSAA